MKTNQPKNNHPNQQADNWTRVLLIIYFLVLVWVILLKLGVQFSYMEKRIFNLVPFANGYYSKMETLLNVLIFIPLGVYAGLLFRKQSFGRQFLFFFMVSLSLEGLQFLFKIGAFDITDLMTNSFGGMIGYLLFLGIQKLIQNPHKTQKLINLLASLGTILIVTLLILLNLNMLPIRYQ